MEKDFWGSFPDELLRFFETRQASVPETKTVEAVTMIEAGLCASEQPGIWINL